MWIFSLAIVYALARVFIFGIICIVRNYGGEEMESGSSSGTKSDELSSKKNAIASMPIHSSNPSVDKMTYKY
jgi:hypothetical protein